MRRFVHKCLFLFCFSSLLSDETEALSRPQNLDGKVLQLPSVQRLLNGLNRHEQTAFSSNSKHSFHGDPFWGDHQRPVHKPGYPLWLRDEGDGALPASSDEKIGEFKFNNNGAVGKGKYRISKKAIDIKLKMTFKRVKTTPTTSPTTGTKPTAKSTAATTKPPQIEATTIKTTPTTSPSKENSTTNATSTTPKPTPSASSKTSTSSSANTTTPTSSSTNTTTPTSSSANTTTPTSSSTNTTTPTSSSSNTTTPTSSSTNTTTTPTSSSNKTDTCKDSPFQKEGLNTHNKYRAIHNSPAMKLNCTMSKEAEEYAQKLADLGSLVQSGYSERPEQGENLSIGCSNSKEESASEAVKKWYDEVCKYNFGEEGPQKGTDHFTQVVWKASLELGLGKAQKDENGMTCTYIVGRYKPQGNFDDGTNGYKDNVVKGSFDESYCNTLKDGDGLDGGYGLKRFKTQKTSSQAYSV